MVFSFSNFELLELLLRKVAWGNIGLVLYDKIYLLANLVETAIMAAA